MNMKKSNTETKSERHEHRHAGTKARRHAGTEARRHADTQTCRHTGIQAQNDRDT